MGLSTEFDPQQERHAGQDRTVTVSAGLNSGYFVIRANTLRRALLSSINRCYLSRVEEGRGVLTAFAA